MKLDLEFSGSNAPIESHTAGNVTYVKAGGHTFKFTQQDGTCRLEVDSDNAAGQQQQGQSAQQVGQAGMPGNDGTQVQGSAGPDKNLGTATAPGAQGNISGYNDPTNITKSDSPSSGTGGPIGGVSPDGQQATGSRQQTARQTVPAQSGGKQ